RRMRTRRRAANGRAARGRRILQTRQDHSKPELPNKKRACKIMAPTIAWVVETGVLSRVASMIHVAATRIASRMEKEPGDVWRLLWVEHGEHNLIEVRYATTT